MRGTTRDSGLHLREVTPDEIAWEYPAANIGTLVARGTLKRLPDQPRHWIVQFDHPAAIFVVMPATLMLSIEYLEIHLPAMDPILRNFDPQLVQSRTDLDELFGPA